MITAVPGLLICMPCLLIHWHVIHHANHSVLNSWKHTNIHQPIVCCVSPLKTYKLGISLDCPIRNLAITQQIMKWIFYDRSAMTARNNWPNFWDDPDHHPDSPNRESRQYGDNELPWPRKSLHSLSVLVIDRDPVIKGIRNSHQTMVEYCWNIAFPQVVLLYCRVLLFWVLAGH